MQKIKCLLVIGTRPEAIKMVPVIRELNKSNKFEVMVCNTGQHASMLDQVMELFDIKVDFELKVIQTSKNLHEVTANVYTGVSNILIQNSFDLVLVHGDTSTCLSSSLASFYSGVPVAHIEAGLRSGDVNAPWPEEINRILVGRLASLHFCPTVEAKKNLLNEGVSSKKAFVVGNTVIDTLFSITQELENDLHQSTVRNPILNVIDDNKKLILVTGHRRENFGSGFKNICESLKEISQDKSVQLVYPVHLNPNVQHPVYELLDDIDNVILCEPLDYMSFVHLMIKSYFIITDSGGIQEEAAFLGKPVLLMRETTERPEAVENGNVRLVGTDQAEIVAQAQLLMNNNTEYLCSAKPTKIFGDGNSAKKIIVEIENYLYKKF